jgi:hypothetical protein
VTFSLDIYIGQHAYRACDSRVAFNTFLLPHRPTEIREGKPEDGIKTSLNDFFSTRDIDGMLSLFHNDLLFVNRICGGVFTLESKWHTQLACELEYSFKEEEKRD